ncbi:MAG: 3-hydroxybutyryl-CoA dehydrogenase [Dehalococcoidia bacterium]|nr:3-hydroxybutyryl-CoA dehydrogenase [Dehalococcoidia bacterium]
MDIRTVSIIGDGELVLKLQELLAKADVRVGTFDLSADYAGQVMDVDIVLEVAPEDIAVKKKVFKNCDAKCRKDAILATTTANPWVTQLARVTKRPEKVVGLNLTKNPFEEKYLAQTVRGLQTSDDTIQVVKEFLEKAGITVVKLEETPGFILDRVIASIVNEAAVMYSSKLATKEDIDKMMKVCVNWPMGPFEFADNIGVDRVVEILDFMSQELGPKYQPCFLLRKMVDAGWLGKRTGRGFYVYS